MYICIWVHTDICTQRCVRTLKSARGVFAVCSLWQPIANESIVSLMCNRPSAHKLTWLGGIRDHQGGSSMARLGHCTFGPGWPVGRSRIEMGPQLNFCVRGTAFAPPLPNCWLRHIAKRLFHSQMKHPRRILALASVSLYCFFSVIENFKYKISTGRRGQFRKMH